MNVRFSSTEAARPSALAAAVLALAAAGAASGGEATSTDVLERFAGAPFTGTLEATVNVPEEAGGDTIRDRGHGTAQFVDLGDGKFRLELSGHIKEEGDAGFVLDGIHDEAGLRGESDGVTFQVASDGTISGGGRQPTQRLLFDGAASASEFDLTVEIVLDAPTENGLPAGTVFQFHYDLTRSIASAHSDAEATDDDCPRIVWQARNIATFSGAMSLIQVPVCMK